MPKIMPITALRDTTEISETCHNENEPIFITKNGYGDLVIMSLQVYDDLFELKGPNADTLAAIEGVEMMEKDPSIGKTYRDVKEMMAEILSE